MSSKLEIESEAKCDADKFFNMLKYSLHHMPLVFPESFKSSDIIEGDGYTVGTVRHWKYAFPGSDEVLEAKETIEEMDDANRCMTLRVLEGHIKDHYSHFVAKISVKTKGDGCLVKWIIEYEKADETHPDPLHYIDLIAMINQKLDAHLILKEKRGVVGMLVLVPCD